MSSATDKQRKALGKGLSALLPPRTQNPAAVAARRPPRRTLGPPRRLPVEAIQPNPMQPRSVFNSGSSWRNSCAASIRANGIIQPIIVRRHGNEDISSSQANAGLRAAKLPGEHRRKSRLSCRISPIRIFSNWR